MVGRYFIPGVIASLVLLVVAVCGTFTSSIPPWAFVRANANYQITMSYQVRSFETVPWPGGPYNAEVSYTIIKVNEKEKSFNSSFSGNPSGWPPPTNDIPGNFDSPAIFPVVTAVDLAKLNRGINPNFWAGSSVKPGVTITVKAGKF